MNVFKVFKEFPVESSECNNICIWKIFSCCRSAKGQPPAHQAPAWFQACNGRFVPILLGALKPWNFNDFPIILGVIIIPTDELTNHHFSGLAATTNQL
jgi:hypothetical protein